MTRIVYEVELSYFKNKFFILVRRKNYKKAVEELEYPLSREQRKEAKNAIKTIMRVMESRKRACESGHQNKNLLTGAKVDIYASPVFFCKTLWQAQAKQLIRLFNADLTAMVSGLIKINEDFDVDFSFVDKVLTHMIGLQK